MAENYQNEMSEIWSMVRDTFLSTLSRETVELWFGEVQVVSFQDNCISLTIPSEFKCNIIRDKYLDSIRKGFCNLLGFEVQVEIDWCRSGKDRDEAQQSTPAQTDSKTLPEQEQNVAYLDFSKATLHLATDFNPDITQGFPPENILNVTPDDPEKYALPPEYAVRMSGNDLPTFHVAGNVKLPEGVKVLPTLNSIDDIEPCKPNPPESFMPETNLPQMSFQYTFDNFIIGDSNKFAHAACVAVAQRPASNYNPLFIYGQSGLGKTHLMNAIINELKAKHPEFNIVYIKGDDFTNQLISSIMNKNPQAFRDKYRKCDVLLIDDIQFIAGKEATQDEFFHTFNSLYEEHKQIILTSDRPPRDIKTLEDRLKSRFEWGLIADIQPPDLELRIAIIKKKAEEVHIELPEEVVSFLAENLRSNIRQIEGAIQKLSALSSLSGKELNMDLARGCISELLGGAEPVSVTVERIFAIIQKKYGIKKEDIVGTRRTKEVAMARHITIYLIRTVTDMSLPNIGKIFGRDHSTIMSSIEIIKKRVATENIFNLEIQELNKEISGH